MLNSICVVVEIMLDVIHFFERVFWWCKTLMFF
jgi:hypothetical protein